MRHRRFKDKHSVAVIKVISGDSHFEKLGLDLRGWNVNIVICYLVENVTHFGGSQVISGYLHIMESM